MSGWIVIPDWHTFQHYRDRTPIWIKNYTELMSDDGYLGLTLHQRGVLHGLWMEYARARRQIPDSTSTVSRRLGERVTRATLNALKDAGFIDFSDSKPLAEPEQNASPEKSRSRKESPYPLTDETPKPATTNGTRGHDHAKRARQLYERTHDPDQVADWLAGIPQLSTSDRDRILHDATT